MFGLDLPAGVADAIAAIGMLASGWGVGLAATALLAESRGHDITLDVAARVARARYWFVTKVFRRSGLVRVGKSTSAWWETNAGTVRAVRNPDPQPLTDDPAENRLRWIEDELLRIRAERDADLKVLDQRFEAESDKRTSSEQRIIGRLDKAETKTREVLQTALNREMRGLLWVAGGTVLQGLAQLLGP